MQFKVMLNDSCHAICSEGRVYLDTNSSLNCTPKCLDFEMLLNPFKEKLYALKIFLKESNLCGRYLHVVGQVDKCLVLVSRIICDAKKNDRIFLYVKVIRKSDNLVRKNTIGIIHGATFTNDLILKIYSLPYHKAGLNLINMIEPFQVKVSTVKHIVTSLFVRDYIHRALVMFLRLGDVDEPRNIHFYLVRRMHLDACFCAKVIDFFACNKQEFCRPEDAQAKIYSCLIEGIHPPVYLKDFVDSLLSRKVYHMIGKFFKDVRLASFVYLARLLLVTFLPKPR